MVSEENEKAIEVELEKQVSLWLYNFATLKLYNP